MKIGVVFGRPAWAGSFAVLCASLMISACGSRISVGSRNPSSVDDESRFGNSTASFQPITGEEGLYLISDTQTKSRFDVAIEAREASLAAGLSTLEARSGSRAALEASEDRIQSAVVELHRRFGNTGPAANFTFGSNPGTGFLAGSNGVTSAYPTPRFCNGNMICVIGDKETALEAAAANFAVEPIATLGLVLDSSVRSIEADPASISGLPAAGATMDGTGTRIAILDTGIDYTHSDLDPLNNCTTTDQFLDSYRERAQCTKVRPGGVYVQDRPPGRRAPSDMDIMDYNGHGTHVASIAASEGTRYRGVAPKATLIGYKVANYQGVSSSAKIVEAINDAVDPDGNLNTADGAHVINISLGGGTPNPDDVIARAIRSATRLGTVVVVAAGNSGSRERTIGSPGSSPDAIAVGAGGKNALGSTNRLESFSSRGPVEWGSPLQRIVKPDVFAPGVCIQAARARYSRLSSASGCGSVSGHISLHGTSMASPHVAGVAALLRQAHPDWTAAQIKSAILGTAVPAQYNPNEQGFGRVSASAALRLAAPIPVVELAPVSTESSGVPSISGRVTGTGLRTLEIQVAKKADFVSSSDPFVTYETVELSGGTATFNRNLDRLRLPYGQVFVRVKATDANATGLGVTQISNTPSVSISPSGSLSVVPGVRTRFTVSGGNRDNLAARFNPANTTCFGSGGPQLVKPAGELPYIDLTAARECERITLIVSDSITTASVSLTAAFSNIRVSPASAELSPTGDASRVTFTATGGKAPYNFGAFTANQCGLTRVVNNGQGGQPASVTYTNSAPKTGVQPCVVTLTVSDNDSSTPSVVREIRALGFPALAAAPVSTGNDRIKVRKGEMATVALSGGDGQYEISTQPAASCLSSATIEGSSLKVTANSTAECRAAVNVKDGHGGALSVYFEVLNPGLRVAPAEDLSLAPLAQATFEVSGGGGTIRRRFEGGACGLTLSSVNGGRVVVSNGEPRTGTPACEATVLFSDEDTSTPDVKRKVTARSYAPISLVPGSAAGQRIAVRRGAQATVQISGGKRPVQPINSQTSCGTAVLNGDVLTFTANANAECTSDVSLDDGNGGRAVAYFEVRNGGLRVEPSAEVRLNPGQEQVFRVSGGDGSYAFGGSGCDLTRTSVEENGQVVGVKFLNRGTRTTGADACTIQATFDDRDSSTPTVTVRVTSLSYPVITSSPVSAAASRIKLNRGESKSVTVTGGDRAYVLGATSGDSGCLASVALASGLLSVQANPNRECVAQVQIGDGHNGTHTVYFEVRNRGISVVPNEARTRIEPASNVSFEIRSGGGGNVTHRFKNDESCQLGTEVVAGQSAGGHTLRVTNAGNRPTGAAPCDATLIFRDEDDSTADVERVVVALARAALSLSPASTDSNRIILRRSGQVTITATGGARPLQFSSTNTNCGTATLNGEQLLFSANATNECFTMIHFNDGNGGRATAYVEVRNTPLEVTPAEEKGIGPGQEQIYRVSGGGPTYRFGNYQEGECNLERTFIEENGRRVGVKFRNLGTRRTGAAPCILHPTFDDSPNGPPAISRTLVSRSYAALALSPNSATGPVVLRPGQVRGITISGGDGSFSVRSSKACVTVPATSTGGFELQAGSSECENAVITVSDGNGGEATLQARVANANIRLTVLSGNPDALAPGAAAVFRVSGGQPQYTVTGPGCRGTATLAQVDDQWQVTVTNAAATTDTCSGTLTVEDEDPSTPKATRQISFGAYPKVKVSPSSVTLDFRANHVFRFSGGDGTDLGVGLRNAGCGTLTILSQPQGTEPGRARFEAPTKRCDQWIDVRDPESQGTDAARIQVVKQ